MDRKPIRRISIEAALCDICAVVGTSLLIAVLFAAYFGPEREAAAPSLTQQAGAPTKHSLTAW
jgi:hypothetical protein